MSSRSFRILPSNASTKGGGTLHSRGAPRVGGPCMSKMDSLKGGELTESGERVVAKGWPKDRGFSGEEAARTRLIGELTRLVCEPEVPEAARSAGLTLIGWLARRMPGERAHALGVREARESEARLRARKTR